MRKNKRKQHRGIPQPVKSPWSALALTVLVSPAVAADAGTAPAAKGLDEVVVTARRRDENLEKVPVAVSAIGAEQLSERQVRSDSDLQLTVPGLTIRQTQGNNSLTYAIRGQSADTFSGSPSAVVAYLDEVPISINGASTFYDLQSVQVLKGPQGTLFGRNATGGAVLYTTAKPTNATEAMLRVRAGNYDLREVEGMVNVPLVDDKVLMRVAFDSVKRDGYIHDIVTDKDLGETDRNSGRVTLTVKPNERLENTTVFGYTRTDGTNTGATYIYSIYPNTGADFFLPGEVAHQKELGYYKTQYPFPTTHVGEDEILVNTTIFDFSDELRLKNIFGYTRGDTDSEQPALGAEFITFATRNYDTGVAGNELEVESFSDEFQLSGEAFGDKLTYITGVYLQSMRSDTLWPQTYFEGVQTVTNNFRIETDTAAVYAQGTYSLTPELRATAGVRYTQEDVSIEQLSQSDALDQPGFSNNQDETFEKPSWEVGLEYDLNPNTLTYVKTRGSFRSGGFNGSAQPVDADATGGGNKFDAETVTDIELGLKYQGLVLDRPARMNIAIYKEWVEDVQRIEFPDPDGSAGPKQSIAVTANIPEMEVSGIEIDASFMPADWLEFGVSAAHTEADFTDGETTLFGKQYSYGPVANTPENTWTVWSQVEFPVAAELGKLNFRAEVYGQDEMYFSNTAHSLTPDTLLPSYHVVNARLNWAHIMQSQFSTALFGKNLADEEYFVGGMPLGASLGHNAAAVGEPRTYGVELTFQY
jgi:iron complex outermembrane receptor protein